MANGDRVRRAARTGAAIGAAALLVGVASWACGPTGRDERAAAPTAPAGRPAHGPRDVPSSRGNPATTAAPIDEAPVASPPAQDVLAPLHAAPALGLELGDGTRVDVDPFTGRATLLETDARLPLGLGLRRAYSGAQSQGLFGRGWRSEADATLHALDADRVAIRRVEGTVLYTRVRDGLWASALGELEWLVRTPEGWEVRDPAGRLHRFDAQGRLTELLPGFRVERGDHALRLVGGADSLSLALDAQGRATRATGPGVELRYEYDAEGQLVGVTGSRTRTYGHEAGLLREVRGERGLELRLTRDASGRLARLDAPGLAPAWRQVYRFERGRAEVVTPRGAWRYALRTDGWRVETPGGVERITLDERGRVVAVRRAGGPARRVERDARGQVVASAPAPAGLPGEVITPAGRRWSFERDEQGRTSAVDGPPGRLELERDQAGRRRRVRDAAGRELHLVRDARGLVEEVAAGDGSAIPFAFDDAGRLIGAGSGAGRVALAWTDDGRLASTESAGARLEYSHEPGVERVATPWGELARVRDRAGRVSRLETPAGTFTFEHDAAGRRVAVSYPNGVVTQVTRDADGRVTSIVAGDALTLAQERDAHGAVVARIRDGAVTRFGHDAAGRLTSAGQRTWAVDADGDRVAQDGAPWTLDERGRLVRAGDERFEHDASGRLIRRGGPAGETRYGWDAFGRLVEVVRTDRAGAVRTVRYEHDGLGRLASRTTDEGTTRFVYERGQRLAELGPGDRVRLWLHGPGLDEPLAYRDVIDGRAGPWVFLHADELGTVLAYTDEDGARVDQAELDPFGVVVSAPAGDRPLLFAGRVIDPDAGLVDLRARSYAPDLGRFLQPDPAGLAGGPAAYVYADGRPLELRDPLGLWPWSADDEDAATSSEPATATTTAHALAAWVTGRALSATRWAADQLDAGRAALRDARLSMIRAGFVDQTGVDRPYGSTSTFVNLVRDDALPCSRDLLDGLEGALGLAHELVAIDGDGRGALAAAHAGYRDAALGYGRAKEHGQRRYERMVDTLLDDGHSPARAFADTAAIAIGETVTPIVSGWEAAEGLDFDALVDRSEARRLSDLERLLRAAEVGAELLGGANAGKAAKVADAATDARRAVSAVAHADDVVDAARLGQRADDAADAARLTRHADDVGPAARAPQDGLAQALDADTPRGSVTATPPRAGLDAAATDPIAPRAPPALEGDCVYVLDDAGQPVRIGNYVDDPDGVMAYLREHPTDEVLVSSMDEARALKRALRHEPDLPGRPRIFADDDLARAGRNHAANSGAPCAPPPELYQNGSLRPPRHRSADLEPTDVEIAGWQRQGRQGGQDALVSEARAAWFYDQSPTTREVILGENAAMRRLGVDTNGKKVDGVAIRHDEQLVPFEVKNQEVIHLADKGNAAFAKFTYVAQQADMNRVSHFEVIAHTNSNLPTNHRVDPHGWVERLTAGLDGPEWEPVVIGGKRVRVVRADLGEISID